jgi:leucyl aminopeptidase (aminopeptidase T)
MTASAIRSIFRVNLGVRKTERVLVFTDKPGRREAMTHDDAERRARLLDVVNLAAEIGRPLVKDLVFAEYPATGMHGKEPPAGLWECAFGPRAVEAIKGAGLMMPILAKKARQQQIEDAGGIILGHKKDTVDAVVALSNYSTSHTTFRELLTRVAGARYASMPLFDVAMLHGAMNVDWRALARRTKAVATRVRKAVAMDMSTPNGTRISFSVKGRKVHADTGILTRPGSFGNLPAGEVYLAPVEGSAQGTLVLEWAPTRRLKTSVELTVRDGLVTNVSSHEEFAAQLEARLSERAENANIAELGIGTNPSATRPDNILESEKILGTVHMALGDNSTFGGTVKTPFHQDFVFFRPTLTLIDREGDGTVLVEDGRLAD